MDKTNSYTAGHRQRLKEKIIAGHAETMADYELLETLLAFAIPRKDVKPLAKDLLKQFGAFSNILDAPLEELTAVDGMGQHSAAALKTVKACLQRYTRQGAHKRALEGKLDMLDYLYAKLGGLVREEFHVLYLNAKNELLSDVHLFSGTVNAAAVYPREIIREALSRGATAMILAHNHPSGHPQPSAEDIQLTQDIAHIGEALGVKVFDHVIIGGGRHYSFRDHKQL